MEKKVTMEKIISLAKRRGFIYQGSEIYGGLAGTWDYGPLGVMLKENIKKLWWQKFVDDREGMYRLDASIIMNQKVWQASGHAEGFSDPLIEDSKTKNRFRVDHLLESAGIDPTDMTLEQMVSVIEKEGIKSPDGNSLSGAKHFNMMFETRVGATEDENSLTYLRPETAQGIFVNFKNIVDTMHPNIPFGVGQIGKAFRNEIAPRDFIFRSREFEQMEVEYFVHPDHWAEAFEDWRGVMLDWCQAIGLSVGVTEREIGLADRAHYSDRTIDFEFDYPFGRKELYGLAYRTDYDLKKHAEHSTVDLSYLNPQTKEKFIPHVIEPSLGLDRTILAVLLSAYTEDELGGETRVYLKLPKVLAPVEVAVFPLLRNKPDLVSRAKEVYQTLRESKIKVMFDDSGNIGKRYRRQDEIGTPYCLTVDFDSLEDNAVTVRDRDTGEQKRIAIAELTNFFL